MPEPEPEPVPENGRSKDYFDHEKLDAFNVSIEFVVLAHDTIRELPKGRTFLADQLLRAAVSVPLNIAEGAGEYSPKEKARFYRNAKRSATECAAVLSVLDSLGLIERPKLAAGRALLLRIVAMLVQLAKSKEISGSGRGTGAGSTRESSARL